MNPFFPMPMPQGPPPMFGQKTRYFYRTRDGGPPDMGKPPSVAPPFPPFCFGGPPPPGPPPPPPFCFGGPPPPPGPPPGPWAFQPPPAPPAPASHMCFQNAAGTTCVSTGAPPAPPAPPASMTFTTTTTSAPFDPATYKGPICYAAASTTTSSTGGNTTAGLAPGNRVNERIVKADDGSGVLLSPDQTCFHVLEPGQAFGPHMSQASLVHNVNYKVQYADSDWPVDKVIELLGGKKVERTGRKYLGKDELVGVQQWIEAGNGLFVEGSLIMLNDAKSKKTLREVGWGPENGRAGQKPPVWVMLYPVKEHGD